MNNHICNSIFKEYKMIFEYIKHRMSALKLDKTQDLEVKLWTVMITDLSYYFDFTCHIL